MFRTPPVMEQTRERVAFSEAMMYRVKLFISRMGTVKSR